MTIVVAVLVGAVIAVDTVGLNIAMLFSLLLFSVSSLGQWSLPVFIDTGHDNMFEFLLDATSKQKSQGQQRKCIGSLLFQFYLVGGHMDSWLAKNCALHAREQVCVPPSHVSSLLHRSMSDCKRNKRGVRYR